MNDISAFVAVARAGGFREAARVENISASRLSDAIRRLERELGVRLFHRNTRSVVLTEVGLVLLERMNPVMNEFDSALDMVNLYRDKPSGKLRLNVPVSAVKLILPAIVPEFLEAYPDIELEVTAESDAINIIDAGFDAGIRYDERLEQDMIAVPIGPRQQRYALAAAPKLLDRLGRPAHPRDLLNYPCLTGRFRSGLANTWGFEKDNEVIEIKVSGPLVVNIGSVLDLAVDAAVAGTGVVYLFEEWLQPYFDSGQLEPILDNWWLSFSGPYLYYSGRRLVPTPLRTFIDFVKSRDIN
ncbi:MULTISPECIES: LysR family transcriptional regulator [Marinomonas]|nr:MULTISPECIES: LysR family transcriptional regulator [Marinomonas]QRV24016.1 LysR family transcriptional regulator [Marinomonas foliarum]UTW01408.1 LysR family transcriptional regulator [Marinomonas rhizomae]